MENEKYKTITKSDGTRYTVRKDRHRYFFPDEWNAFYKTLRNDTQRLLFSTLLNTGTRIMEALHLRPKDFNFQRGTISIRVVKYRKTNKKLFSTGMSRTFFVGSNYLKQVKKYIRKHDVKPEEFFFLNNEELPENYLSLPNKEKKKYYYKKQCAYTNLFERKLKKAGIEDYKDFSLHNIRKTYGNWMRVYDIDMAEICFRMGHDMQTFMSHYGSSLLFDFNDKIKIKKIFGEIH